MLDNTRVQRHDDGNSVSASLCRLEDKPFALYPLPFESADVAESEARVTGDKRRAQPVPGNDAAGAGRENPGAFLACE